MYSCLDQQDDSFHRGELFLIPTNNSTVPKPNKVSSLNDFPTTAEQFRSFFYLKPLNPAPGSNRYSWQLYVKIRSTQHASTFKKRIMPTLRSTGVWMDGNALWNDGRSSLGWIYLAHTRHTHRDSIRNGLFTAIENISRGGGISDENRAEFVKLQREFGWNPDDISLQIRTVKHKNTRGNEIATDAIVISCRTPFRYVMRDIFAQINANALGDSGVIVPFGYHKKIGNNAYCNMLIGNNDFFCNHSGLVINHLHPSIVTSNVAATNIPSTTFTQYCIDGGAKSIQETTQTGTKGTFVAIVPNDAYDSLQQTIETLIRDPTATAGGASLRNLCIDEYHLAPTVGDELRLTGNIHRNSANIAAAINSANRRHNIDIQDIQVDHDHPDHDPHAANNHRPHAPPLIVDIVPTNRTMGSTAVQRSVAFADDDNHRTTFAEAANPRAPPVAEQFDAMSAASVSTHANTAISNANTHNTQFTTMSQISMQLTRVSTMAEESNQQFMTYMNEQRRAQQEQQREHRQFIDDQQRDQQQFMSAMLNRLGYPPGAAPITPQNQQQQQHQQQQQQTTTSTKSTTQWPK